MHINYITEIRGARDSRFSCWDVVYAPRQAIGVLGFKPAGKFGGPEVPKVVQYGLHGPFGFSVNNDI